MKNTWKRTIAILLSVLLLFATLPMAFAGNAGASVNYELDSNGVMKITGSGPMDSYTSAATVPWKDSISNIRQVFISSGVTTVGSYAFAGCTNLIELTIPVGMVKIETNAFAGCTSLRIVTLPNTTNDIGLDAFSGCTSMDTISILNTSCAIANTGTTIPASAKIYGYNGSTAEKYAKDFGRTFVSLNSGTQQVEENPAAVSGNTSSGSLDQILKTLTTYIQPLLNMFKGLFSQLLAGITSNSNSGSNTSTTGGTGTTSGNSTADAAGIFSGILSSFASFVTNTLSSMNSTQGTTAAGGTTAATGTTAAASTGSFDLSSILALLGKVDLSALTGMLSSATTTTAAAK